MDDGYGFWQVGALPSIPEADPFVDAVPHNGPAEQRSFSFGEAVAAAAQGMPLPLGANITAPSPNEPPLRRFGSEGTRPTFGQKERNRRRELAKTEMQAFNGVVDEICIKWSRPEVMGNDVWTRCMQSIARSPEAAKKTTSEGVIWFNIIERECYDDHDEWSDELKEALEAYIGRYHSTATILELPPERRIGLVPEYSLDSDGKVIMELVDGVEEHKVSYYREPTHAAAEEGHFAIEHDAYGTTLNYNNLVDDLFEQLRNAQKALSDICIDTGPCFHHTPPGMPGSSDYTSLITSRNYVTEQLRALVNPDVYALPQVIARAQSLRNCITQRHSALYKAATRQSTINKLVHDKMAKREAAQGELGLLEYFNHVDSWKMLVDFLDAASAACLLRVLIGSSERGQGGKLEPDQAVVELIRGRYPHLHIYEVIGAFPHDRDGASGRIYCDRYMELSIGFVSTTLRANLRSERLAAGYVPPLSQEEKEVDAAKVRAGASASFLKGERHSQLVADGHDFGVDEDEDLVRAVAAGVLAQQKTGGSKRRVTNDGWSLQKTVTNHDLKYQTHETVSLFLDTPTLKLSLVNFETGEVVETDSKWGPLEPDQWLRAQKNIYLNTQAPNSLVHVRGKDVKIKDLTSNNVATLVRVKPTLRSSAYGGAKFVVRVEATAQHRRTGNNVKLVAESKPMTFVADKRTVEAQVGYGRKRKKD
jgi:hypothetical protein